MLIASGILYGLLILAQAPPPAADEALQTIALFGESERTARRLVAVDAQLAARQWPEAIQELQRIILEASDDLVPSWTLIDGMPRFDQRQLRPARWLCHQRLAALPAEALTLYRQRVEAPARQLLEEGRTRRDPIPLRKLADQFFCSQAGGQTLDLLGDLAFERGAFEEAERWWRLLAPRTPTDPSFPQLMFPAPTFDLASVRAKQLLARLFHDPDAEFRADLERFRQQYPKAAGHLAGRQGNYAAILEEELNRPENRTNAAPPWPTFAGDPTRSRVVPVEEAWLRRLGRADFSLRRVRLDTGELRVDAADADPLPALARPAKMLTRAAEARRYTHHPALTDRHVLLADPRYVLAFAGTKGTALRYDLPGDAPAAAAEPDAAYTVTVAEGRVYARLGAVYLGTAGLGVKAQAPESFLVCLEVPPAADALRQRWLIRPPTEDGMFEGAPLVQLDRVYVACTQARGERARTAIHCYDADTGRLRWRQELCETDEFKLTPRRARHHLLSWAGGRVVYGSHSGAIVALEADTGRRAWAARYSSRGPRRPQGQLSPRGLAPCLVSGGRVFVAPTDYGRILCLEAETGTLLWESNPLEVVDLLGVLHNRLVLTALTPYPCIRALNATTGGDRPGELFPDEDAGLLSFGRGVLTTRAVLWPTADGVRVLDVDTLRPRVEFLARPIRLRGNLAIGPNHLVAVEPDVATILDLIPANGRR